MNERRLVSTVSHFLHTHFLWFLLGSYVVAALWPTCGLWVRDVSVGQIGLGSVKTRITLPMLMLALLLLNAGLGVKSSRLRDLLHSATLLGAGLAANLILPIAFIFGVSLVMRPWREPDEVQQLLVGLALVASMPIAGSSTAWSQNNNGSMALSLGLVLLSTLLSPLSTPAALHSVGLMTRGSYSSNLHQLAAQDTGLFLTACVVLPSIVGIFVRAAIGGSRIDDAKPHLKLANSVNLLLLNYSNASVSLPNVLANPDWGFLIVTLGFAVALCVLSFTSGWWLARLFRAEPAQRIALMFGLGMNNNGTGLVLASLSLAHLPNVMLPIILYNLVQHLIAGGITTLLVRRSDFGKGQQHRNHPVPTDCSPNRSLNMKWITREKVKVDRVACPWLIKKFIDPNAEFFFVPTEKVMEVAQLEGAVPFDVQGVEFGHHGKECSFDALVKKHQLGSDRAIVLLAKIVNGADTDNSLWNQPEAAGLNAIAEGFRHLGFKNDLEVIAAESIVYDALYAYCQEMVRRGKPDGQFR